MGGGDGGLDEMIQGGGRTKEVQLVCLWHIIPVAATDVQLSIQETLTFRSLCIH